MTATALNLIAAQVPPPRRTTPAKLVVQLRPAGHQRGFGSVPGFPLYNIVSVDGSDGTEEYWLQSTVTRETLERLGFKVELVPNAALSGTKENHEQS